MSSKKEQEKKRAAYRAEVLAALEQLRRAPVGGSERRYVEKKDWVAGHLRHETVEVLADYIQAHGSSVEDLFVGFGEENATARALWLCYAADDAEAAKKKKTASETGQEFDPHAEGKAAFRVDIRAVLPNVHVVAETLEIYLRENSEPLFPVGPYEAFLAHAATLGVDDAKREHALTQLLAKTPAPAVNILHRLVLLANSFPQTTRMYAIRKLGPAVFFLRSASQEQDMNTADQRVEAFRLLCDRAVALLPKEYTPSAHRLGQARHYAQRHVLKENEWQILCEGNEKKRYKSGEVIVTENTEQTFLYRIVEGSVSVYVGETRVGQLIALDWFGEAAFLGNSHSRARVVAEKRGATVVQVPHGRLSAILLSRPDLASKFYSALAVEEASRLNVALILGQSASVKDLAVDPNLQTVPHSFRMIMPTREREKHESAFVYNASVHAVRVWDCQRLPKKDRKPPREGQLFVFPNQLVSLYQKGVSEKKSVVMFSAIREMTQEVQGSRVTIRYVDGKKEKHFVLNFATAATAEAVVQVTARIRNGDVVAGNLKEFGPVSAVALFDFAGQGPNQVGFEAGDRLTLLDRAGSEWYYGFLSKTPDRKGLIPLPFVELRPIGVTQPGAMTEEDWRALNPFLTRQSFVKGDRVIVEFDAVNSGDLLFVEAGEMLATRSLSNGLSQELGFVHAGETFGELMFLLGGDPRATITVTSETASVLRLSRTRLTELLNNDVFGAKFWKHLSSVIASRLNAVQARIAARAPPVPAPIKFEVSAAELVRAESIGSAPSLPPLPPPEIDPKDALIMKIKNRGAFFMGIDVPVLATNIEEEAAADEEAK